MQIIYPPILDDGVFLLGFSGGADSVALFFSLLKKHIAFDIAIVDYELRAESSTEVAYALSLATQHNKQCHTIKAPIFTSNIEAQARVFRYEFFHTLILKHQYKGLLLAHHFNDRIEWLFMRLGKGSGIAGLLGFDVITWHYSKHALAPFPIIRPLLWASKQEILTYCKCQNLHFFTDSSNADMRYERNYIRAHIANEFVARFYKGLAQSLNILTTEKQELYQGGFFMLSQGILGIYAYSPQQAIHHIAAALKTQGYVLSRKQRAEIMRTHFSCHIFGNDHFCIDYFPSSSHPFTLLITTHTRITLPKRVKHQLRTLSIPARLRPSLYARSLQESMPLHDYIYHIRASFAAKNA